ncbi:2'-5' RNA ligase [Janthinobacterium agaricidamnosum NBRC 102515 = DSM 9628]|uniref:RNA 2',3'-cyclic phosphodiesterase n=2 Tax=Janthinobacterium agaricidamnosum TaxID=55508 RepID=W0V1P9_9BURK|nr:RNA 2',3'-cyclic phosphodiesterase [Janthinobacterium agaricidamnosum]CDG81202.1 2'-5' RNA ligase [Janthinobacterium agaricidamnosum NBRC 102515 = DSM 9628]
MRYETQRPRLFFALWPDAAVRKALAGLQNGLPGKLLPPEKLHMTMAFLGQRPAGDVPALCAILQHLPAPALQLRIDRYGYFPTQQLAWAGPGDPPAALLALRAALMAALAGQQFCPAFEYDSFTPHVTLARKVPAPVGGEMAPLHWRTDQLVLAESLTASGTYRIIGSRQLA